MELKRKENKKRCKLTKELFDLLNEMCSVITPYYQSDFCKHYSKRKTIELEKIQDVLVKLCSALSLRCENPDEPIITINYYFPKLILYISSIHTNNK